MKKYILSFVLCLFAAAMAQTVIYDSSLDKPMVTSESETPKLLKIRSTGPFFSTWSISGIINYLTQMQQGSNGDIWSHYWSNDASQLKSDLLSYYNSFPQSSEVFSATIANGQTSYFDSYGYNLGNGAGNSSYYDATLTDSSNRVNSYNLNFYAGRNTAATGNSELQIQTSTGNLYTIYAYDTSTPIALDMDGDGKLATFNGDWLPHDYNEKASFIDFDLNGDGFDEAIEWIGPNDGLLLQYVPGEKVTGNHLFGFAKGYRDGFEQLATLDANGDGKLMGEELSTLSVWQDRNSNAKADAGEVVSVKDLKITEIGVRHSNMISYFVQNGRNQMMWDWHPVMFMVKKMHK